MLLPISAKLVINEAIPGKNVGLLVGISIGLFVLQALRLMIGYGHDYLIHYIGQRTVFDIRKNPLHPPAVAAPVILRKAQNGQPCKPGDS
ncbi:MAG: hypothetical protein Fur0032_18920 [Terrimicrobiaceae bacterium]